MPWNLGCGSTMARSAHGSIHHHQNPTLFPFNVKSMSYIIAAKVLFTLLMSCLTSIRSRWWCIQIEKKHWCNFNMDWMCENCLIKWLSQLVMTRYAIQTLLGTTCPNHVCGTSSKLPLPLKLHTFCDNCCHVWEWHPIGWDTCIKCPDDLVELSSSIIP